MTGTSVIRVTCKCHFQNYLKRPVLVTKWKAEYNKKGKTFVIQNCPNNIQCHVIVTRDLNPERDEFQWNLKKLSTLEQI